MRSIFQNKTLTLIIILLLVANLGLLVYYSFFKDDNKRQRKRPVTEFLKKEVGFDDKQMKAFEETRGKNRERMKKLFEESAVAKDSFYQLLVTPDLDDSLLFDRALVVSEKQRAIEMEMFRQFKGIQAMCNPEQQKKFDSGFMPMVKKLYRGGSRGKDKDSSNKK